VKNCIKLKFDFFIKKHFYTFVKNKILTKKEKKMNCLNCKLCLDLITGDNPTKQTPITDCFCSLGKWDGPDFVGDDLSDWEWNSCNCFEI